ncbi:MAG: cellulose-binding protein [Oscillatoriales cyanobacterium]|nr:MAG: cellulose-binding protein [Oscillatoriales cyanobacterium]TAH15565.1 MAG: cellulose-binding protein [Oscillatoriales cyanobacterium]
MSRLRLRPKNQALSFVFGLLIFVIFIPGCWAFKNKISPTTQPADNKVAVGADLKNTSNSNSSLGIGLSGIADYSTQLPFLDGFKSSRKWITQCVSTEPNCKGEWDTEEYNLLNLDENGWVKSLPSPEDAPKYTRVSTLLFREIPNRYPSGQYIVLYEGEGAIKYTYDAKKDDAASKPGRDIINVDATQGGGIFMTITATDPQKTGNYIRNIRVVQSQDEQLYQKGEIFNPLFIEKIKKFKVLRFMDWMGTNGSEQKAWSNRPKPDNLSYAYRGNVPIEVMVTLANKIQAKPWFNMPHMAADEYMTNFAKMVKDSLDPKLKVYVEYSNEVWNWSFPQSHYALEQGKAKWGDKGDTFMQWHGMRSAQMCDIWKGVFGEQKNRVVCVLGTQRAWRDLETSALECSYWVAEGNKPCYQHGIDALAVAGYFGGNLGAKENVSTVESWLKDADGGFGKAFKQLKEGGLLGGFKDSLPDVENDVRYYLDVAQKKGLKLFAYEGGQHIVGTEGVENNEKLTNFFMELNRRPEMYELYTQLLNSWKQAGGSIFMHFVDVGGFSKWGSWGALEYVEQKDSPKYNALMDFIDKNPSTNNK